MLYTATRLVCIMLLAAAFLISHGPRAMALGFEALHVEAIPVVLDPTTPECTQVGSLTFLSGFELRTNDKRFGGLSGLTLDPTGTTLYAVSDHGYWFTTHLEHDTSGRLTALTEWQVALLLAPDLRAVRGHFDDAEAVTRDHDGTFLVAFEDDHRIWRYPALPATFTMPPRAITVPQELRSTPINGGIEAMTVLADGRMLLLAEKFINPDGSHKGWLVEAGQSSALSYVASPGFDPTDLATLPGGDVLVLERRYSLFSGFAARLQWLSRPSLQSGASLRGQEVASLALPLTVDNFEGLAVHENAHGEIILYIVSDDNYHFLQRTLLLQFRLSPLFHTRAATDLKTPR